ncbi:hypothetical protein [Streptomyces sp. NPDC047014]|uniref:hypothetical protein n=1 Tax=Streptomyces sp. NPDC047014 TaxID=3155736 RepID=UPI003402229F
MGTSPRPAVGGYDSFTFTRQTADRIAADLNRDKCGLTADWDGDSLIFTASADYNGEAFTKIVTPDEYGHYTIDAMWPWDAWSEDLDPDEHNRAFVRGALTPHAPAEFGYPHAARAAWRSGQAEAARLLQATTIKQHNENQPQLTSRLQPPEASKAAWRPHPPRRPR